MPESGPRTENHVNNPLRQRTRTTHATTGDPRVPRASRNTTTSQEEQQPIRPQKSHFMHIGLGMILALVIVGIWFLASGWVSTTLDDVHYGRPRTFQMDALVGHETTTVPSHFIALNLHGRIEVIELPGGDITHARVFQGPQLSGSNAELIPITLQFVDTRHDHHPDMVVQFDNTQLLFRNTQGTFQLVQ